MQSWLYLTGAITLEVAGTTSMKLSAGFTMLIPSIRMFAFYGLSFVGLPFILKKFDVSVAYAVWSGLGTAFVAVIGFTYSKDRLRFCGSRASE